MHRMVFVQITHGAPQVGSPTLTATLPSEKQRLQSSFLVTCLHAVLSPVWQDAVWIAAAQQAENETGVC